MDETGKMLGSRNLDVKWIDATAYPAEIYFIVIQEGDEVIHRERIVK